MPATYLVNRCPSIAIDCNTPEYMWNGYNPNLFNLRVFGCQAYAHQRDRKLEPRSVKCILLGYPEGFKGIDCGCMGLVVLRLLLAGMLCLMNLLCLI